MKSLKRIVLLAAVAMQSSCVLITDAATRLAHDLEAGAKRLGASSKTELEVRHRPLSFPEGVNGDYDVLLQAVRNDHRLGGTLAVGEVGGESIRDFLSFEFHDRSQGVEDP